MTFIIIFFTGRERDHNQKIYARLRKYINFVNIRKDLHKFSKRFTRLIKDNSTAPTTITKNKNKKKVLTKIIRMTHSISSERF